MYINRKTREQAKIEIQKFEDNILLTKKTSLVEGKNNDDINRYIHYMYSSTSAENINKLVKNFEIVKNDCNHKDTKAYFLDTYRTTHEIVDFELINVFSSPIIEIGVHVTREGFIIINNHDTIVATIDFGLYNLVTLHEIFDALEQNEKDFKICDIDPFEKNIVVVSNSCMKCHFDIPFKIKVNFNPLHGGITFYAKGESINYKIT